MTLEQVTETIKSQAANMPSIGKTLKLVLDEGVIFLDLSGDTAAISNNDQDADCTITTSIDTLTKLKAGSINPMTAVMMGKIKIKGDMGVAMKLQSLLS